MRIKFSGVLQIGTIILFSLVSYTSVGQERLYSVSGKLHDAETHLPIEYA